MKKEIAQRFYNKYLAKYEKTKLETRGPCRFGDIVGNLLLCDYYIRRNDKKNFLERITALRDYFELLEKFPDFRKDEFTKSGGHFPEFGGGINEKLVFDYEGAGFSTYLSHYVAYAKERLK